MKTLTPRQLARMVDISAVRADSAVHEVEAIVDIAVKHDFVCVFAMPSLLNNVLTRLKEHPTVGTGGVVGFPSGGETTRVKLFQAQELKEAGCREIDMVMNIGQLKSGNYIAVEEEIRAVKQVVAPLPLKVIIEVALLTEEEVRKASSLVVAGGADFVKTGTGWAGATNMEHIRWIKETIGDAVELKVAGGVRTLETLEAMYNAGVSRFGIGYQSALHIYDECVKREQYGSVGNRL